jgi:hypothetical protein
MAVPMQSPTGSIFAETGSAGPCRARGFLAAVAAREPVLFVHWESDDAGPRHAHQVDAFALGGVEEQWS